MDNLIDLNLKQIESLSIKDMNVIGIDLGTTNSTVSIIRWELGIKDIIPEPLDVFQKTLEGDYWSKIVPSIVAIDQREVFIGEGAKRLRSQIVKFSLVEKRDLFYECKNELGVNKVYPMAPDRYDTPTHISSHILRFLVDRAMEECKSADYTIVTVPASFQPPQREDTLKAIKLAGINPDYCDLLDEPIAAFIDYIVMQGESINLEDEKFYNLLIFDFGGGTCDVAIFQIRIENGHLRVSPRSVSRYHRIGGGDIDKSILYNILRPKLYEENKLKKFDLGYSIVKNELEPQLLSIAELLKIGLCNRIDKLEKFNKYEGSDKSSINYTLPETREIIVDGNRLVFDKPSLNAEEFESILKPFLDEDLFYPSETDYTWTCSFFAPLEDSLTRCKIDKTEIDLCLMVGGSSLIPQVKKAVSNYFSKAQFLAYSDIESLQLCVSRGASYHAFLKAINNDGLVKKIVLEDIHFHAYPHPIVLVKQGDYLKGKGEWDNVDFKVPKKIAQGDTRLLVKLTAGQERRFLMESLWDLPEDIQEGDRMTLNYRYDENQVLEFQLILHRYPDRIFPGKVTPSLSHVFNPSIHQQEILELENQLDHGKYDLSAVSLFRTLTQLADLYLKTGKRERALDLWKRSLSDSRFNSYKGSILHRMGLIAGEMHDYQREEKFYLEAFKYQSSNVGSMFNLSLSYKKRGKVKESIAFINKALEREVGEGAYYILQAQLFAEIGDKNRQNNSLSKAFNCYKNISHLSDWQLHWYKAGAQLAEDKNLLAEVSKEQRKRDFKDKVDIDNQDVVLPEIVD